MRRRLTLAAGCRVAEEKVDALEEQIADLPEEDQGYAKRRVADAKEAADAKAAMRQRQLRRATTPRCFSRRLDARAG